MESCYIKIDLKKNIIKQKICLTKNNYLSNVMLRGTPCIIQYENQKVLLSNSTKMNVFISQLIDILFNTKTTIKVLLSNSTKMNVFVKLIDILFNTKTEIKVLLSKSTKMNVFIS